MLIKRLIFVAIVVFGFTGKVSAQQKWTLQECITYALDNNLSIQKQMTLIESGKIQVENSRNERLPDVNARLGLNQNFGRSLGNDNVYRDINSFQTDMSVGFSMPLFQGFKIKYQTQKQQASLKTFESDLMKAKDDLMVAIASAFLDVLYNKELVTIAKEQLSATLEEQQKLSTRYQLQDISKDVYLENLAQSAREESQLNDAMLNVQNALLVLAQLLDVEDVYSFDVQIPELPEIQAAVSVESLSALFENVVETRPEIESARQRLETEKLYLKEIRSNYYPSVNLYGSVYDSYYYIQNLQSPMQNTTFSQQLKGNMREVIGLSVNIPIFNKFKINNGVKLQQLQISTAQFDIEIEKKNLRERIDKVYTSALSSYSRFNSTKKALEATRESYRFAQEKYKVGAISPYEISAAKSLLLRAESENMQAKYQFIFAAKVLDFYRGVPIELK